MIKKNIIIVILFILLLLPTSTILADKNCIKSLKINPESHVITDITYIPQTEGYFCYYSCIAMILNYYNLNTSLTELLFLDGLGYTHYYYSEDKLPEEGRYSDINYLFSLFGVEQHRWILEHNNNSQNWNQYISRLTENISKNVPIITAVNPFSLPSLRNQFPMPNSLWNWLFPPGFHIILIAGYNLTNQSICYLDPNAGFYGEDNFGNYAWMSLQDFRTTIEEISWGRYYISTLIKKQFTLNPEQRFEHAISTNYDKLNGTYDRYNLIHGINASYKLHKIYTAEGHNLTNTINNYKLDGIEGIHYSIRELIYEIISKVRPNKPNPMAMFMIGEDNPFAEIRQEKIHVADYLQQNTFHQDLCLQQAQLLLNESIIWDDLAIDYKQFLRKGLLLPQFRANQIIESMKISMEKIIKIESTILEGLK